MATKPPPGVEEFPAETLEKVAYAVVADIETREPNDRNRLGFNVWMWLKDRKGTVEDAIRAAGSRTIMNEHDVAALIKKRLKEKGIG